MQKTVKYIVKLEYYYYGGVGPNPLAATLQEARRFDSASDAISSLVQHHLDKSPASTVPISTAYTIIRETVEEITETRRDLTELA